MKKIMLIEDDALMLSLLRTLLELEGFEVIEFNPEADVLSAIVTAQPNLVFMDVNLKGINGLDIARAIRQTESVRHIFILMASGINYTQECAAAGANGFLLKPFMPDDLIKAIRKVLTEKNP